MPFRPFSTKFFSSYDFSPTATDGMGRIKKEYPEYDLVVMNLFRQILIDLIHPDLVQEFLSGENIFIYVKTDFIKNFIRATGEGVVFSEGKVWKMKRKVLNEIFNFDFIKSLTPQIADSCDKILDRMDKQFENGEI